MEHSDPKVSGPRPACPQMCGPTLHTMIRGDYSEMPGLVLTVRQGARLWNTDHRTCEQVLDDLVDAGFLARTGDTFVRADSWRRRR